MKKLVEASILSIVSLSLFTSAAESQTRTKSTYEFAINCGAVIGTISSMTQSGVSVGPAGLFAKDQYSSLYAKTIRARTDAGSKLGFSEYKIDKDAYDHGQKVASTYGKLVGLNGQNALDDASVNSLNEMFYDCKKWADQLN